MCNLKQVLTVTNLVGVDEDRKEMIMRDVLGCLSSTGYNRSNPEVIKGTWDIITKNIENPNPYQQIKNYYNTEIMKIADSVRSLINKSDDNFDTALKVAITANLIDFAASHSFDENLLLQKIAAANEQQLTIDDSKRLYEKLQTADTLLYLGDNCGEIVVDKIFIETVTRIFPKLKVYYGVRGEPIVNDVTAEDAAMVKMHEVAEVISNGNGSLGTVIPKTSAAFQNIFYKADVIIAKGQGNYESLSEIDRNNIFFLFMAKCEAVAGTLSVPNLSIVCVEYTPS